MDFTIVTPSFKQLDYLGCCIASVADQGAKGSKNVGSWPYYAFKPLRRAASSFAKASEDMSKGAQGGRFFYVVAAPTGVRGRFGRFSMDGVCGLVE